MAERMVNLNIKVPERVHHAMKLAAIENDQPVYELYIAAAEMLVTSYQAQEKAVPLEDHGGRLDRLEKVVGRLMRLEGRFGAVLDHLRDTTLEPEDLESIRQGIAEIKTGLYEEHDDMKKELQEEGNG